MNGFAKTDVLDAAESHVITIHDIEPARIETGQLSRAFALNHTGHQRVAGHVAGYPEFVAGDVLVTHDQLLFFVHMHHGGQLRKLKSLRILAVDDLEVNRRILYEQLRSLGMRPDVASSAEEALEMLRDGEAARDPYAVAVLDFQMPDMNGEQLGKLIKADKLLSDIALVLFTSSGQRGDAKRMSEVGFAGYLTKTTSVETMRDVLATVWADSQSGRMDVRLVTQHSVAEARAASGEPTVENPDNPERRVLIAEDNIVNQKVAKRMLEKLGCVVDVAANGEEAVDMWSKLPYDVVFMDCQMPELDGYAATGRIRERESAGAHTPIVAMTANAMEGDRERCLSAGMDDYMAKPIRIELCREVLERCEKVSSSENLIRDPVS